MESYRIEDFSRGWFIGDFHPTLHNADFEVGIKEYKAGDKEAKHYHKEAEEFTVIISGKVSMNKNIYTKGDIIKILTYEDTDFECIEDAVTVVVKTKSVEGDKYLV